MIVVVEVAGYLCDYFGPAGLQSTVLKETVPDGTTLKGLLAHLAKKYPEFSQVVFSGGSNELSGNVLMVVNGYAITSETEMDNELKDGDSINLVPVLVGG